MHEASLHDRNSFLTLTYEQDREGLDLDDLQRFFKRLRFSGVSMRYYACGEYGSRLGRPHFHVCMFGHDFSDDREPWKEGLWISPELERLWSHGYCVIGDLSFESAAYVARYVTKKVTGPQADDHYMRVDGDTGECWKVRPEFAVMSRGGRGGKGGIGRDWWREFSPEVIRDDSVLARGRECKPPRYYDNLLRAVDVAAHQAIKDRRKAAAVARVRENSDERLAVREVVTEARLKSGRRSYEA